MISPEQVLPPDQLLDYAVAEFKPLIADELEANLTQTVFGEIIDWTNVTDEKMMLAEKFALLIGAICEDERRSMVQGALFARQILHMIYADTVILPLHEYCGDLEVDELRTKVDEDTAEYLASRPHVKELLDQSMPEIDQRRNYAASAEKASAFIFMLAEFHMADEYVTASLAELLSPSPQ